MFSKTLKFLFIKWFENFIYLSITSFMVWGMLYFVSTHPFVVLFVICLSAALTLNEFYIGEYNNELK